MIGKIIVVEGIWHSGKTTFAKQLAFSLGAYYFPEPDHLKNDEEIHDIEFWYFKKFIDLEKKAVELKSSGFIVVLDRCRISVLAYLKAIGNEERYNQLISSAEKFSPDKVILIDVNLGSVIEVVTNQCNEKYLRTPILLNNPAFVRNYYSYLVDMIKELECKVELVNYSKY
jgi:thymidylate kinase